jgi:raffinose/stachyose/melibiose transport system permease protein
MTLTSPPAAPTARDRPRRPLAGLGGRALAAVGALIWLAIVLIPLAYAVIQTLKPQQDELTTSPWTVPHPTLDNYAGVVTPQFLHYVLNSVVTSVGGVLLSTLLGSLAAYALARVSGRINGALYLLFVSGLAVPIYAAIIPIYRFSSDVGLYDTLLGLLLPFAATSLPITVFILTAFMRAIPAELDQAMSIDGAGYLRRYAQLALPLARPAVATVAIYAFINNWNNFILPLVLTQSDVNRTLPLAIWTYQGQYGMNVPLVLTVVVLSTLPLLIFYILQRRNFIQGLTAGALSAT